MPPHSSTIITYGFAVKVRVQDNHLHVSGGIGDERIEYVLHRATSGLARLIILSGNGYISLDALQWLHDVGASLTVIAYDGALLLSDGPRRNSPDLRLAQSALSATLRLELARDLIAAKIEEQAHTLKHMKVSSHSVSLWLPALADAQSLEDVRSIESRAATAYWRAWAAVPMRFPVKENVPDHWLTFDQRVSHLTRTPRRASNPANALLNYAYAVLQGETRLAALLMGLEPAWGFLHSDGDALVYDLMEPARPLLDRWLFAWLQAQTFLAADFMEDNQGAVRIAHPLRRLISAQAANFRAAVAPVIERVARRLEPSAPTLLTGQRRGRALPEWQPEVTTIPRCSACGSTIEPERAFCDRCFARHKTEKLQRLIAAGAQAARTHGGQSGKQRGASNRQHHLANAATDTGALREQLDWPTILQSIEKVPVRILARQTSLSLRYVSLIRRGLKVPHPRHWPAFAALGQGTTP
jgi:CRISPR-associated endonuclease Cas1